MSEEENKPNNETPVESDSSVKKPKHQKKSILSKRKRQKKNRVHQIGMARRAGVMEISGVNGMSCLRM